MADYDSNMIKPVDSLQNITGLAPARRRERRSRRQQLNQDNEKQQESETNESLDEQLPENVSEKWDENEENSGGGIDYRA
jgi:hypothetical protein